MPLGLDRRSIVIEDDNGEPEIWQDQITVDGGELAVYDYTTPGGSPLFDADTTGQDRSAKTFNLALKITGANTTEWEAKKTMWKVGKVIPSSRIVGMTPGIDYVIRQSNEVLNSDESPAALMCQFHELRPTETTP